MRLSRWLSHPLTRGLDVDDPRTTELRRRILDEKRFLRRLYGEWYRNLAAEIPAGSGAVVELGSGAGFLGDFVPDLVRSDLFPTTNADLLLDARRLPFARESVKAFVMTNVLHHVSCPADLLAEAGRAARAGAVVAMLEPWVTPWSRRVYSRLHDEPFDCDAGWELIPGGPLSSANGALPWILFERDRALFERAASAWRVRSIRLTMPVRYLLSGGLSLRVGMPAWTFGACRALDRLLELRSGLTAMFAYVVLERRADQVIEPALAANERSSGAC